MAAQLDEMLQAPSFVDKHFTRSSECSIASNWQLSQQGEAREGVQLAGIVGSQVLVVETDESFRRLISDRLRLERYTVHEACQESEARRMLLRRNLDVVLLGFAGDRQMALALLMAIKKMRPLVEVILLRSSEDHSLAVSIQGMKLGAFDELMIPFDVETLVRRIQEACRRKGQRESDARQKTRTRRCNNRGKRGPNGQDQSPAG